MPKPSEGTAKGLAFWGGRAVLCLAGALAGWPAAMLGPCAGAGLGGRGGQEARRESAPPAPLQVCEQPAAGPMPGQPALPARQGTPTSVGFSVAGRTAALQELSRRRLWWEAGTRLGVNVRLEVTGGAGLPLGTSWECGEEGGLQSPARGGARDLALGLPSAPHGQSRYWMWPAAAMASCSGTLCC